MFFLAVSVLMGAFDFSTGVARWNPTMQVASGAPALRSKMVAYESASYAPRLSGWSPGNDSVNSALFFAVDTLRARSRDMVRKNAWAFAGPDEYVSEAIGTGIVPRSKHRDLDKRKAIQELWLSWTDNADAAGLTDYYGLQALALRSVVEGGDVIIRYRPRLAKDKMTVPLQLQVLEAEHLPTSKNESLEGGNVIRAGVEFDQIGRRVGYWLYPQHPGEFQTFSISGVGGLVPVRVPALGAPLWTAGASLMFKPIRPGQVRGEPWLARALVKLYELDQFVDADLEGKKVAAMFAGFITENDPNDPILGDENTPTQGSAIAPPGISFAGMEPGTMQKLRPGEGVTFSTPPGIGTGLESFIRPGLREAAKAMGVTYEQLTGDLTGVNFSSIRAGLLAFRRRLEQFQHNVIVYQFCRPTWRAFIESAVIGGEISAADYFANQADYLKADWIPQGQPWVDPVRDLEAAKGLVRNGFKSRSRVVAETGYDVEEVDAEIAADNKRADETGNIYDSDSRQTSSNGNRPDQNSDSNPDGIQETK